MIQTISAVDKDEPLNGHRFYFSLAASVASNLNFTLRDNKGAAAVVILGLNGKMLKSIEFNFSKNQK